MKTTSIAGMRKVIATATTDSIGRFFKYTRGTSMVMRTVVAVVACVLPMALTAPPVSASGLPGYLLTVAMARATIPACRARNIPGAEQLPAEYEAWQSRQSAEVRDGIRAMNAQIDSQMTPAMQAEMRQQAATTPEAKLRDECANLSAFFRGEAAKVDPARASAQSTWDGFVAAMRAGDKEAAKRFLGGVARDNFEAVYGSAEPQKMVNWALRVKQFSLVDRRAPQGPIDGFVTLQSGLGAIVTFDKTGPNWIIVAM